MGRREITDRMSWEDQFEYVAYTADALALAGEDGDKEVGALAAAVEKLLAKHDALSAERRARRRAIGRSHALVKRRDIQLDSATTDLHNDTLGHVRQDRTHPLFLRFFADGLSWLVRMALPSQLPESRTLLLKLVEPETPAELKKAHEKPLGAAIERGEAAIKGREEAFAAAGRATAQRVGWREDGNRVLLGIEGALKKVASERRLKADWVDSFFAAPERGARGAKEPAEGGEDKGEGGGDK